MTLQFQQRAQAAHAEMEQLLGLTQRTDRFAILYAMSERGIDTLSLVDWLGGMTKDSFWEFGPKDPRDPAYTSAQVLYMREVCPQVDSRVPAGSDFLSCFFGVFVPIMYVARNKNTEAEDMGSESGWTGDVKFIKTMEDALAWINLQMPHLRALHELCDAHYQSASLATVQKVAASVAAPFYEGRNKKDDLTKWICAWVQLHIRHYVCEFCEREQLNGEGGETDVGANGASQKPEPKSGPEADDVAACP